EQALDCGAAEVRRLQLCGLIDSAALSLQGCWRIEALCHPERSEGSSAISKGVLWSGREVLRYAQDDKMRALRAALDEGEASGDFRPFDFQKFIAAKKAKAP
ncbi:MAG TPA: type II toxin-antitoxin system ParD family antitoxin, partial [Reyranella sp.]|nr:type II toxin-antitoxin system ParD family antitoxin [Reyranella sp.]